MKNKKNKKHRIRSIKRKLLTYLHDRTGRMLNMTRAERKAESKKASNARKLEKVKQRMADLEQAVAATE